MVSVKRRANPDEGREKKIFLVLAHTCLAREKCATIVDDRRSG